ncbi:hypothetical protein EC973_004425 [Apophysomyces ossiformis]|uniref:HMG box domain-containing protein n=1 Tax=Apophysomyces ossiformis TaxID=679940 RepID=A0A8H7ET90_9FUNG|nr:hypothetical protein EC973_004425 [Apophysomyces ossiformis]
MDITHSLSEEQEQAIAQFEFDCVKCGSDKVIFWSRGRNAGKARCERCSYEWNWREAIRLREASFADSSHSRSYDTSDSHVGAITMKDYRTARDQAGRSHEEDSHLDSESSLFVDDLDKVFERHKLKGKEPPKCTEKHVISNVRHLEEATSYDMDRKTITAPMSDSMPFSLSRGKLAEAPSDVDRSESMKRRRSIFQEDSEYALSESTSLNSSYILHEMNGNLFAEEIDVKQRAKRAQSSIASLEKFGFIRTRERARDSDSLNENNVMHMSDKKKTRSDRSPRSRFSLVDEASADVSFDQHRADNLSFSEPEHDEFDISPSEPLGCASEDTQYDDMSSLSVIGDGRKISSPDRSRQTGSQAIRQALSDKPSPFSCGDKTKAASNMDVTKSNPWNLPAISDDAWTSGSEYEPEDMDDTDDFSEVHDDFKEPSSSKPRKNGKVRTATQTKDGSDGLKGLLFAGNTDEPDDTSLIGDLFEDDHNPPATPSNHDDNVFSSGEDEDTIDLRSHKGKNKGTKKRAKSLGIAPIGPRPTKRYNPFFLFNKEVRHQISQENPELRPGELSKIIAQRWKELDQESKDKYVEAAEQGKKLIDEARGRRRRNEGMPPNAFILFSRDAQKDIRKEFPEYSLKDINTVVTAKWRELSEEKKQEYRDTAAANRQKFAEENPEFVKQWKRKKTELAAATRARKLAKLNAALSSLS